MNELEMAKKRDHKIMITDEAIEKVSFVKYKEIHESEYLMLQELAKEVLTVSKNDNDSNEVALTYSLDYRNLIAEGKEFMGVALGDEHSVDPWRLVCIMKEATYMTIKKRWLVFYQIVMKQILYMKIVRRDGHV